MKEAGMLIHGWSEANHERSKTLSRCRSKRDGLYDVTPSSCLGQQRKKNDMDHMILLTYLWIIVFTDIKNWCERPGNWFRAGAVPSALGISLDAADLAYAKNGEDCWTTDVSGVPPGAIETRNDQTRLPPVRCAQGRRRGGH
jgi:hypothetical protein